MKLNEPQAHDGEMCSRVRSTKLDGRVKVWTPAACMALGDEVDERMIV